jgi:hypothetical protein
MLSILHGSEQLMNPRTLDRSSPGLAGTLAARWLKAKFGSQTRVARCRVIASNSLTGRATHSNASISTIGVAVTKGTMKHAIRPMS